MQNNPLSTSLVQIDDFAKVDIRVGLVTNAKPVENSKKLIELSVDLGTEVGARTVLTGLLQHYPDMSNFIGKKFLFIVNLAPRVMAGIASQGMFLAVDSPDGPKLLEQSAEQPIGTKVR